MTDLPPYPGGTGTGAANRLRQVLRQIDGAINVQREVLAALERDYTAAFATQDQQTAVRNRIRNLAFPNRRTNS